MPFIKGVTQGLFNKTFRLFKSVFVTTSHFHPSVIFEAKGSSLPL
jgi:hypothetical protein